MMVADHSVDGEVTAVVMSCGINLVAGPSVSNPSC